MSSDLACCIAARATVCCDAACNGALLHSTAPVCRTREYSLTADCGRSDRSEPKVCSVGFRTQVPQLFIKCRWTRAHWKALVRTEPCTCTWQVLASTHVQLSDVPWSAPRGAALASNSQHARGCGTLQLASGAGATAQSKTATRAASQRVCVARRGNGLHCAATRCTAQQRCCTGAAWHCAANY